MMTIPPKPGSHEAAGRASAVCLLLASLCLLAACAGGAIRAVDILPEDMCARCRMAISEKRCAVEFILKDGTAVKFDDLACMAGYVKEKQNKGDVEAFFVADYEGGGWIRSEHAYFVRSPRISTPMRGGTVAFKERSKAETAAATYQGEVKSFAEVMP